MITPSFSLSRESIRGLENFPSRFLVSVENSNVASCFSTINSSSCSIIPHQPQNGEHHAKARGNEAERLESELIRLQLTLPPPCERSSSSPPSVPLSLPLPLPYSSF